jgi:hypothetical protein
VSQLSVGHISAQPHKALTAAELLAKLEGHDEPDKQRHQHVRISVSADVIEQLRSGLCSPSARERGEVIVLGAREKCALPCRVVVRTGFNASDHRRSQTLPQQKSRP